MQGKSSWARIALALTLPIAAPFLLASTALAERYTLRVGAGHPAGPSVYATVMRDYLVPELGRRVQEETEHELRIIEGYGGSIASVAETLEAVQIGILDIGGYCTCFEPAKLFLHNFQYFVPFGPRDSEVAVRLARQVYSENPWLAEQLEENYNQELIALNERQIAGLVSLEAAGATVRELSEEVRQQWAVSLKDFPGEMAREASSRGMPGAAVMRSYIAAATQTGHHWPVQYTIE